MTWAEIEATSPDIENLVIFLIRSTGNLQLSVGIFLIAIAYGPYKRGEKWAWYTFALFVASLSVVTLVGFIAAGAPGTWVFLSIVLMIIYGLGLALPYRKFFPRT